jgi:excisionase family DNA binding protein
MTETRDRWLTREEAATYLRLNQATITRYVKRGILTPCQIGGTIRFDREQIDQILTDSKGETR